MNLIGIAAAAALGFYAEPDLRVSLTGLKPSSNQLVLNQSLLVRPADGSAPIPLSSLRPDQLPATVTLQIAVSANNPATGESITLPAGGAAKLVRVDGINLVVSPVGQAFFGSVPYNQTDLLTKLAQMPALTAPPTPSTPTPQAEPPSPPVSPLNPSTPDPLETLANEKAPEVTPTPPPTAPTASSAPNEADIVAIMKESIQNVQITEFKFADVLEWKAAPAEDLDGATYQIGLASYRAETIFGVKTFQAKALIKDGKVNRWIGKKSGQDLN